MCKTGFSQVLLGVGVLYRVGSGVPCEIHCSFLSFFGGLFFLCLSDFARRGADSISFLCVVIGAALPSAFAAPSPLIEWRNSIPIALRMLMIYRHVPSALRPVHYVSWLASRLDLLLVVVVVVSFLLFSFLSIRLHLPRRPSFSINLSL